MFQSRSTRLLYVGGKGFDVRAQVVMDAFVKCLRSSHATVELAKSLLVSLPGYEMSEELRALTDTNAAELSRIFSEVGTTEDVAICRDGGGDDEMSPSTALREGTEAVVGQTAGFTDIVLDVSSLPRVAHLALVTGILARLVPNKADAQALYAGGVNFHVVVAEDARLDGLIRSEDPSPDLVVIPGFASALYAESVQDWPLVWFPILGENRLGQFERVLASSVIPELAEICPVVPHPSRDPRRADQLLIEYRKPLFDSRQTPTSNILYVHESNPFEAYRQLLQAMMRYRDSLRVIGGCRLVVTPLGSKLVTLGAGLACFEMHSGGLDSGYGVAIPYAEPTRYTAQRSDIVASRPELAAVVLTGESYGEAGV